MLILIAFLCAEGYGKNYAEQKIKSLEHMPTWEITQV